MDVVIPVQKFYYDGQTTTQYMSSSSSPKRFIGDPFEFHCRSSTAPASPTDAASSSPIMEYEDEDFAFDFSGHLDKNAPPPELAAADELFYKGKIRPLKIPPFSTSPAAADHLIAGKHSDHSSAPTSPKQSNHSKKWRFKDLLLFRSASEGRATGDTSKDPLRKYTAACLSPKGKKVRGRDERRGSSFRCESPHAALYAANRAAAEEMRRKTALPYKEGFLNWLRFG